MDPGADARGVQLGQDPVALGNPHDVEVQQLGLLGRVVAQRPARVVEPRHIEWQVLCDGKGGVWVLGEHAWWRVPFLRRLAASLGVVDGTPENADRLLQRDELVLHRLRVFAHSRRGVATSSVEEGGLSLDDLVA